MSRFRFKVAAPDGKVKAGYVGAADLATAEERLVKAGYYVLELEPVVGGIQIEQTAPQVSSALPPVDRATPRNYRPSLGERIGELSIGREKRNTILAGLALMGLAIALFTALSHRQADSTRNARSRYRTTHLTVTGRVAVLHGSNQGVAVTFHLPEIPLDVTRPLSAIATDKRGDFTWDYRFAAQHVPTYISLSVSRKGYRTVTLGHIALQGDPLSCEPPTVILRPRT